MINIIHIIPKGENLFKIQKMKNGGKPHSYIFKWYFFGYLFIFIVVAYLENWF